MNSPHPFHRYAPMSRKKPMKRGRAIRRVSSRRRTELKQYAVLRREFLEKNPWCQTRKCCKGAPSRVVSHKKGRGIYYLDISTWGASCVACELWMTLHSKQAIAEGLAMDRIGRAKP